MKVLKLEINNFLGVKAVAIEPTGNVVRIEGPNEAGKSSIIDSIWTAIGGREAHPVRPIHDGAKDARIFLDLGEITVERTFTEKGTYLTVKNKDGFKAPSPQDTLNKLFSRVSFDPTKFITMKPAERRDMLLDLTGQRKKIDELETRRKDVYEDRAIVNKEARNIEGMLSNALPDDGEPVEEKSVAALMAKLEKAREADQRVEERKTELDETLSAIEGAKTDIIGIDAHIEALHQEIAQKEQERETMKQGIVELEEIAVSLRRSIEDAPPSEAPSIEAELNTIDEDNARVRKIKADRELRKSLETAKAKSDNYTAEIQNIDADKASLLENSALPVDGIGIDGDTLLIDGTPFDDLATSRKIRVAMKIGIATNPTLRVIRISQGSELDARSIEEVRAFAEENDVQVWMECVADSPHDGFFIQDGTVVEPELVAN